MVKWCTFASEYNMLVLSANYITFLYSCYLENNPSSNDIIHICCQLFSNYLRECVVFLSMFMLMPLLSVEVLLCTCLYNDNHILSWGLGSVACCLSFCYQCNHESRFNKLHSVCFKCMLSHRNNLMFLCKYIMNY